MMTNFHGILRRSLASRMMISNDVISTGHLSLCLPRNIVPRIWARSSFEPW